MSNATSSRTASAPIGPRSNGDDMNDELSQETSASFSSFGKVDDVNRCNNFGRLAFHGSFRNDKEFSPATSQRSSILRTQSMHGAMPSRKVPVVLGSRSNDGGLSAFQIDGKEAMIIESLLETTKETSPTKRKEAMIKWLHLTAAEIMSPSQHDAIVDSQRLSHRTGAAEIIPSPSVFTSETTTPKKARGGGDNPEGRNRTGEELSNMSEHDEVLFGSSSNLDEDDVVLDSARILGRSLSKRKSYAAEKRTRLSKRDAKPLRSRSHSSGSRRRAKSGKNNESQRTLSPRKQKAGTKTAVARQVENPTQSNALAISPKVTEKPFIDKFLDHDVEQDDSESRVVVSPGGTVKTTTKDDIFGYKVTLLGDSTTEASMSKLRMEPNFMSPSKRTIVHDSISRRDAMRKMKSVPNLRVHSEKLVELFVAENKPQPSPAPSSTPKAHKRKSSKKLSKESKEMTKTKKKKHVTDVCLSSSKALLRHSATEVGFGRALNFRKSKSMSCIDQRSLHTVDRQLLVQRLESLSPQSTIRKTQHHQPTLKRQPKVPSTEKKQKAKSASPVKCPKTTPTAEKKRKCKSEHVQDIPSTPRSLKFTDTGRPFSLSGDRWRHGVSHSKSSTSKQSNKKHSNESEEEIFELSSPPLQPQRKASRDPSLQDWREASKSTPNLLPNDRANADSRAFKATGDFVAEVSILEVPDDNSICSELTDAHSEVYVVQESPRKKGGRKLKAINEATSSFNDVDHSVSDSLTKDKTLHLSRRWDDSKKNTMRVSAPQTPRRNDEEHGKDKKIGWLKKKLGLIKLKHVNQ
jgi:hypothetical protein